MDHAARTSIEETIADHLRKSAKGRGKALNHIDQDQPFFEAGILDSLSLLDFVAFVEEQYRIEVAPTDILPQNFGTLRAVTDYVFGRLQATEAA